MTKKQASELKDLISAYGEAHANSRAFSNIRDGDFSSTRNPLPEEETMESLATSFLFIENDLLNSIYAIIDEDTSRGK